MAPVAPTDQLGQGSAGDKPAPDPPWLVPVIVVSCPVGLVLFGALGFYVNYRCRKRFYGQEIELGNRPGRRSPRGSSGYGSRTADSRSVSGGGYGSSRTRGSRTVSSRGDGGSTYGSRTMGSRTVGSSTYGGGSTCGGGSTYGSLTYVTGTVGSRTAEGSRYGTGTSGGSTYGTGTFGGSTYEGSTLGGSTLGSYTGTHSSRYSHRRGRGTQRGPANNDITYWGTVRKWFGRFSGLTPPPRSLRIANRGRRHGGSAYRRRHRYY
jgi:hypothetical protein